MAQYNGKVNIMGPNISTKFYMMDKIPVNTNTNYQNVLTGNFERSRLSDAYFSKQNIQIIQNGIRKGVYDKSQQKILIDNQPEDQIVTVMRSMYLQHSKNLEINIAQQIEELNTHVLQYCVFAGRVSIVSPGQLSSPFAQYVSVQFPQYSSFTCFSHFR